MWLLIDSTNEWLSIRGEAMLPSNHQICSVVEMMFHPSIIYPAYPVMLHVSSRWLWGHFVSQTCQIFISLSKHHETE